MTKACLEYTGWVTIRHGTQFSTDRTFEGENTLCKSDKRTHGFISGLLVSLFYSAFLEEKQKYVTASGEWIMGKTLN